MNFKKNNIGSMCVVIAAMFWGISGVVYMPRLSNLSVSFAVFMMYLIPFLFLSILFFKEFPKIIKFKFIDIILLILVVLFGGIFGTLAIVKAIFLQNFKKVSVVVLLQKLQPIFAIILARIFLKEKLKNGFLFYFFIVLFGSYLLSFGFNLPTLVSNNFNNFWAIILSIFAAFCFGASTVISKSISTRYSFKTITFFRYMFSTLFMFIFITLTLQWGNFSHITSTNYIIFLAILVTSGPFSLFLYYYGIKFIKASSSAVCEMAMPITALFMDYVVNKSYLSAVQIIGTILVIFGIYMISIKLKSDKSELEH